MSRLASATDTLQCSDVPVPEVQLVCSCKPHKISSLFSSLNEHKKSLIRSLGFGGLLKLPLIENLNRDLCLWLFQITEFNNNGSHLSGGILHIPGGVDLPFEFHDVDLVFGIPCDGLPVSFKAINSAQTMRAFTRKLSCARTSASLTISFLEEVLTKDYGSYMTADEVDVFNIATVLYACTYLLAPRRKHSFPVELVENFVHEVNPKKINWASLVFRTLARASSHARLAFYSGQKKIDLFGCGLFLQILYLDNLNFGLPSPFHDQLPRASVYSPKMMCQLISSDCIGTSDQKLMLFGNTQVRDALDVLYTRGLKQQLEMFFAKKPETHSDYLICTDMIISGIQLQDYYLNQVSMCSEQQLDEAIDRGTRAYLEFKPVLDATKDSLTRKSVDFLKRRNMILYHHDIHPDLPAPSHNQRRIGLSERPMRMTPNTYVSPMRRTIERRRLRALQSMSASGSRTDQALPHMSLLAQLYHGQSSPCYCSHDG